MANECRIRVHFSGNNSHDEFSGNYSHKGKAMDFPCCLTRVCQEEGCKWKVVFSSMCHTSNTDKKQDSIWTFRILGLSWGFFGLKWHWLHYWLILFAVNKRFSDSVNNAKALWKAKWANKRRWDVLGMNVLALTRSFYENGGEHGVHQRSESDANF